MIIARLQGGLGNQMFQYATARRLALRHDVELKLDLSELGTSGRRDYALGNFAIVANVAGDADLARWRGHPRWQRARRWIGRRASSGVRGFLWERDASFDPRVLTVAPPAYLVGYWQCERYFAEVAPALRNEFRLASPPSADQELMAQRIRAVEAVAVHVRRTDYVTNRAVADCLPVCPPTYYDRAIQHILEASPSAVLFWFSDEPQWTRAHMTHRARSVLVSGGCAGPDFGELWLMSQCRHHVIANSSFSWWGAWLAGGNPDQQVVAPARWFATDERANRTITPDRWHRI